MSLSHVIHGQYDVIRGYRNWINCERIFQNRLLLAFVFFCMKHNAAYTLCIIKQCKNTFDKVHVVCNLVSLNEVFR